MRYFCINEKEEPVAVVFQDYRDGTCICRSRRESFLKSFEQLRGLVWSKTVKEQFEDGQAVRLISLCPTDYDWIDSVLGVCNGSWWTITDEGTCVNDEQSIDELVGKFFG